MKQNELNDLALSALDGYWTLCTPMEAMMFFADEYLSMTDENKPFYLNDEIIGDRDVVIALSQLLAYFINREPDTDDYQTLMTSQLRESRVRKVIRKYLIRRKG